jgi:hypothetical protein
MGQILITARAVVFLNKSKTLFVTGYMSSLSAIAKAESLLG